MSSEIATLLKRLSDIAHGLELDGDCQPMGPAARIYSVIADFEAYFEGQSEEEED